MSVQILGVLARRCDRTDSPSIKNDTLTIHACLTALQEERMKWNILKAGARHALWCAIAVAMCVAPAFAQTTGRLVGTIVDAQGAVLPGVTITVTSPNLQGSNVQVTDATGQF